MKNSRSRLAGFRGVQRTLRTGNSSEIAPMRRYWSFTKSLNLLEAVYNSGRKKTRIFSSRSGAAKILTAGILSVFWGLKFEPDAEIGEKDDFHK